MAICLVTGAASGLGFALAGKLYDRGADLILVDEDKDGLDYCKSTLNMASDRVWTIECNLSDPGSAEHVSDYLFGIFDGLDLLVNNAGAAIVGDFLSTPQADFDWLMSLNFETPIRLIRSFLPSMMDRPGAHIVNISSLFGLVAPAGQTAYAASKFALRGFSEALRHELLDGGPSVTTVHPAGTHTHMVCHSSTPDNTYTNNVSRRYETLLTSSPEDAASDILRAVETRKARLLIGPDAHHADWLQRFVPHNYWTWMKPRQALRCE